MIEGIPTWKDEVMSVFKLVTDWKIMVLTPAFLASNWFYAYQLCVAVMRKTVQWQYHLGES